MVGSFLVKICQYFRREILAPRSRKLQVPANKQTSISYATHNLMIKFLMDKASWSQFSNFLVWYGVEFTLGIPLEKLSSLVMPPT